MESTEQIKSISENLILKLEMSKQIFIKASEKVHNEYMKDAFSKLAYVQSDFQKQIARYIDVHFQDLNMNLKDKITVESTKLAMQFDSLLLTRNEKEILGFVKDQASMLIDEYQEALEELELDKALMAMLARHKATIEQNYQTLVREYDGYVYA